jgi:actin related protein 2/3 complex, subunit 5
MADGAFRKIDIDQYDPDLVTDADLYEPFPLSPADALAAAKEREREVRAFMSR